MPHILCECKCHMRAWQFHHNHPGPVGQGHLKVSRNTGYKSKSLLYADSVVMNQNSRKILIINLAIPFDNKWQAFTEAQKQKLTKCIPGGRRSIT